MIEYLKQYPVKLLAKKVETHRNSKKPGKRFFLLSGFYFCEPIILEGQEISVLNRITCSCFRRFIKEIDFDSVGCTD